MKQTADSQGQNVDQGARIAPLRFEEMDANAKAFLEGTVVNDGGQLRRRREGDEVNSFLATMLRHPKLFMRWSSLGGWLLLRGSLSVRHRELLCLRVAWLCQAAFEWGEHVSVALAEGFSHDEITAIIEGPDDKSWLPLEAALLRACDELHSLGVVSTRTWDVLAAQLDERPLIETLVVIGQYHTVAFVQSSLRLTPQTEGLAAR